MPKIAAEVQERLKKSDREMARLLGMFDNTTWRTFKESKGDYVRRIVQLFEVSGLSEREFIKLLRKSSE